MIRNRNIINPSSGYMLGMKLINKYKNDEDQTVMVYKNDETNELIHLILGRKFPEEAFEHEDYSTVTY